MRLKSQLKSQTIHCLLTLCLASLGLVASQRSLAQETAPYAATVIVNEAPIRSGPATKYYVTDLLDRGANVEVYKNIRGWCAIRPPKGSFCWVPSRQVKVDDSGKIAEVVDSETYAWIGSNVKSPAEHGYQVQLHVGEKLSIVGEKRFERRTEQVTETYYKIEPPSGEFRWVESRFLSKPPASASSMIAATPIEKTVEKTIDKSTEPAPVEAAPVSHDELAQEPAPLPSSTPRTAQPLQRPAPASPLSGKSSNPSPAGPHRTGFRDMSAGVAPQQTTEIRAFNQGQASKGPPNQRVSFVAPFESESSGTPAESNLSARDAGSTSSANSIAEGDFDDQLAGLETQLVLTVTQPIRDWNLAVLRAKANRLKEVGATALQRGRAHMVLDRIGIYETHQKQALELEVQRAEKSVEPKSESRQAPVAGAPWKPAEDEEPVSLPPPEQTDPSPVKKANWMDKVTEVVGNGLKGSTPATPTHFDAQGKLQRVHAKEEGTPYPDFALVNDEGVIVAFVDSPVLKLDKYLGKRIGVYGRRGLHTASQTTYIEAVEMVDLEITQRTKPLRTTFGTLK